MENRCNELKQAPASNMDSAVDKAPTSKSTSSKKMWLKMFSQLVKFKEEHGHILVPNRYIENRSLGYWVSTQRHQYKLMKNNQPSLMNPEREELLNSIGFVWVTRDPHHDPWEQNFLKLLEYVNENGDCNIETKKSKLGSWASTQRVEYKRLLQGLHSRMTERRIRLLEMIGFNWESKRGAAASKVRRESKNQVASVRRAHGNIPFHLRQQIIPPIRKFQLPPPRVIRDEKALRLAHGAAAKPKVYRIGLPQDEIYLDSFPFSKPIPRVKHPSPIDINPAFQFMGPRPIPTNPNIVPGIFSRVQNNENMMAYGLHEPIIRAHPMLLQTQLYLKPNVKRNTYSNVENAALGLLSMGKKIEANISDASSTHSPPKRFF